MDIQELDLDALGLVELSEEKAKSVDGGILGAIALCLAWDFLNDPDSCITAMKNGWADAR